MPRRTPSDYLQTHRQLAELWSERPAAFGLLAYRDQLYLHGFFVPSQKLSDEELLAHRKQVSAGRPSLPQCAGRALRRLQLELEGPVLVPARSSEGSGDKRVVVRGIARPQVGTDMLVRALVRATEDLAEQDRKARDHDDSAAA